jgi:DNA adenine methylase
MFRVTQLFYHMGSKHLLCKKILPLLLPLLHDVEEYREPFIGAGAIGLSVMARRPRMACWLNDIDPAIISLWEATRLYPDELIRLVREFSPDVAAFRASKAHIWARDAVPPNPAELIELGFHQLAVATMRWSGHGGSPRGGYSQREPRIGERWLIRNLSNKIRMISRRLKNSRITAGDFAPLILDTSKLACLFLDPPYWDCPWFDYDFSHADHRRLARLLKQTDHAWLLTYRDHPAVRQLYEWAHLRIIERDTLVITSLPIAKEISQNSVDRLLVDEPLE